VASLSQGRTAAAQCGLFTYKSVPVIFEPPCIYVPPTLSFDERKLTIHCSRFANFNGKFDLVRLTALEATASGTIQSILLARCTVALFNDFTDYEFQS